MMHLSPIFFFLVSATTLSSTPPNHELKKAALLLQSVQSLSATMHQEKELSLFGDVLKSSGHFAFQRPKKLRMDLSGPGGTILIINGDEMILHYKALKKTERHQLSRDIRSKAIAEHLFLLLDANPESLAKTYTIKIVQSVPLRVQLIPKAEALRKLIATIDAEISSQGYVSQLVLNESNGDKTRWRFTEPVLNTPINGDLFTLP